MHVIYSCPGVALKKEPLGRVEEGLGGEATGVGGGVQCGGRGRERKGERKRG